MNDLRRKLAPITKSAWSAIDEEARQDLEVVLTARRIVDFKGPLGWTTSAVGLGRVQELPRPPFAGVSAAIRGVQRLVELRVDFELPRAELDALERGAAQLELEPVRNAARAIAAAEDRMVFYGYPEADIEGIFSASQPAALTLTRDYLKYPLVVSEALARLHAEGVGGPYAIALGPDCYKGLTGTATSAGYPVLSHVRQLIGSEPLWAPSIDGALVASLRGGDFELIVGRDLSVGYADHSSTIVKLYLQESLTFRVLSPEAAVPLVYR